MRFQAYRTAVGLCLLLRPMRWALPGAYAAASEAHLTLLGAWLALGD